MDPDHRGDAGRGSHLTYGGTLFADLLALVTAAVLTPALARWARRRDLLDVPNDRSSHSVATPRIGGIAIIAAVIAGAVACQLAGEGPTARASLVLTLAVAMGLLGFVDDIRPLPALLRLAVQSAVAVLTVILLDAGGFPGMLVAAGTVFWIVAATNAFNFMDGVDGIAGAQAVVAGLGWAGIGLVAGWRDPVMLGIVIALASVGFLLHNWQPARVFMGDAGSGFLGFLFAALPLTVPVNSMATWGYAALLMWPFLFDTGFTLLRRLRRGENVFSAHRTHLYQRLTLTGMAHRDVALLYAGMASLGLAAAVLLVATRLTSAAVLLAAIPLAALSLWRAVVAREARA